MYWKFFIIGICVIIMTGIFSGCLENSNDNNDEDSEEDWRDWPINLSRTRNISGYSSEDSDQVETFGIWDDYVTRATFILNWTDEPDQQIGPYTHVNQPDSFNFTIFTPWQEVLNSDVISNQIGEPGIINLTIEMQENDIANSSANGEWIVNIHCGECGNYNSESGFNSTLPDTGNGWEFSYFYEYHSGE